MKCNSDRSFSIYRRGSRIGSSSDHCHSLLPMFSVLGLHMNVPKINLRFDRFDVEIRVSFFGSNDVSVDGGDDRRSLSASKFRNVGWY